MSHGHGHARYLYGPSLRAFPSTLLAGAIKSVQAGVITIADTQTTGTATVVAVVLNNSILIHLGQLSPALSTPDSALARVELTNTTTVTATRAANVNPLPVSFVLLEFLPGVIKSRQTGTISLTSVASATATITGVNITKTALFWLGYSTNRASLNNADLWHPDLVLTNTTTITASVGSGTDTTVVPYQAVEFF